MALNYLVNSGMNYMKSGFRSMFSYSSTAASSLILDRIFGRSMIVDNSTRQLAEENAQFLDNALRVVNMHNSFMDAPPAPPQVPQIPNYDY